MRVTYPLVVLLLVVAAARSSAQMPDPRQRSLKELMLFQAELERAKEVLVPGDPRLTQYMVSLDHNTLEMIFDFPFSDVQRRELQRLLVEEWKGMPQAKKQEWVKNLRTWVTLYTYRNYERNLQRAFLQSRLLELLRKKDATERGRMLLNLYEEAYKPGSALNPVLVAGDPPLTQQLMDRYRDYLEVMLDLSFSGGFTAEQRKALQDHVVKGWKKMGAKDHKELLADLKTWSAATDGGDPVKAKKAIAVLRPTLLARLSAAREDECSQWLLGLAAQERKQFEVMTQIQRQFYETQMNIIRNIGPGGTWEYNGATGRYDRWVPDR